MSYHHGHNNNPGYPINNTPGYPPVNQYPPNYVQPPAVFVPVQQPPSGNHCGQANCGPHCSHAHDSKIILILMYFPLNY